MQSVTVPFELDHRRRHWPAFRGLNELVRYEDAASELMAILALADDQADLLKRVSRIVVGLNHSVEPMTAEDLAAAGAMAVRLEDSSKLTLLLTLEHTPVQVHAGP